MRTLARNKKKIYYANYVSDMAMYDDNGLYTGDSQIGYTAPVEAYVNLSASKGDTEIELFGTDINYSNVIVTDTDLGMDEHSILWIDREYTKPHNYVVVRVAKTLNSVTYAINKVETGEIYKVRPWYPSDFLFPVGDENDN